MSSRDTSIGTRPRTRGRVGSAVWLVAALLVSGATRPGLAHDPDLEPAQADVDRAMEIQGRTDRSGAATQRRIDALDDESRDALLEYRRVLDETAQLDRESERLERSIASQKAEQERVDRQLAQLEVTQRAVLPLMDRMLATLEEFVALDVPFLTEERTLRLASLRQDWDRTDIPMAEKFRALISAYRVEAEYGRTFEAYEEGVDLDGDPTVVEVLRLGRVGLYSLGLDGREPRIWDRAAGEWKPLDASHRAALQRGIAIARRRAPPELIRLPIVKSDSAEVKSDAAEVKSDAAEVKSEAADFGSEAAE